MIYFDKGIIATEDFKNKLLDDRQSHFATLLFHIQKNGYMVCFPENGTNGHKKIYIYTDEDFLDLNKNHRPALSKYVGIYQYMYGKNSISEKTILRNKIEVLHDAIIHLGLNNQPIEEITNEV